jgi:excisionase family DNA binding protein
MEVQSTTPKTPILDSLLNVKQAAKVLGISPKTLRDHILHRRITYVKIEGRVLFRPDTLLAYIEANTVRARVQ